VPVLSKVLIVDDEEHYREHLAKALMRDAHLCETAANGRDAIALGCRFRPDVLIVDWMLKNHIHGLHVTETLQAVLPDMHAILITGFPSDDLRASAGQAGIDDFIEKPFDLDQLRAAVRDAANSPSAAPRRTALPVIELAGDGSILFANPAVMELFAEAQVDSAATHLQDLFPPGETPNLDAAVAQWLAVSPLAQRPAVWHLRSQSQLHKGSRLIVLRRQNEPQHLGHALIEMLLDVTEPRFVRWPLEDRVLVLDQEALNRRVSVTMLESTGAGCYAAGTLSDAIQLLVNDEGIRFVVLDLSLLDGNSSEPLQRIRAARRGVVIIGTGTDDRRQACAAAGAEHFLPKPWRVDLLINLLMRRIGSCIECGLPLPLRRPAVGEAATDWVCRYCGARYHAVFDDCCPPDVLANAGPADQV
jgi:two-component system, response regulator, stage 0 sporulation protein F